MKDNNNDFKVSIFISQIRLNLQLSCDDTARIEKIMEGIFKETDVERLEDWEKFSNSVNAGKMSIGEFEDMLRRRLAFLV